MPGMTANAAQLITHHAYGKREPTSDCCPAQRLVFATFDLFADCLR
jgi:hypothetical protein